MRISDQLFKKVKDLAATTKSDLKSKGIVIPTENNGSVKFNNFEVIKTPEGFYAILNQQQEIVVDKINLPHTAIVVANKLALGLWVDSKILSYDTEYGYNVFEEEQFTRLSYVLATRKDWVRVDAVSAKSSVAHQKAHAAKKLILRSFEKLQQKI